MINIPKAICENCGNQLMRNKAGAFFLYRKIVCHKCGTTYKLQTSKPVFAFLFLLVAIASASLTISVRRESWMQGIISLLGLLVSTYAWFSWTGLKKKD